MSERMAKKEGPHSASSAPRPLRLSRRHLLQSTAAVSLALTFAVRRSTAGAQTPSYPPTATVAPPDGLNLRSGPGTSYSVITTMPGGAQVTILGTPTPDNWWPVQYNGQSGWADGNYLNLGATASQPAQPQQATSLAPQQPATATVLPSDGLNLRAGPSTSAPVLTVIPGGATVTITGASNGGWTPVTYNGVAGWVQSTYIGTGSGPSIAAAGAASSGAATLVSVPTGAAMTSTTAAYGTAAMGVAGPPETGLTPTTPPSGALGQFVWPVDSRRISTMFQPSHQAIDIAIDTGQPVHAVAGGIVSFAGGDPGRSYGLYIIIQHPGGYSSLYAHLSNLEVQQGASVKQGDEIGRTGLTGRTTGPHIHFAMYYQGMPINPLSVLPIDGIQVLSGANDVV